MQAWELSAEILHPNAMLPCNQSRAEQELLPGAAPGSRTCTAQVSLSRLVPPPHTVPSRTAAAARGALGLFCSIHTSWWASQTFLIILPNICSQFVPNSSLCSSLPDSGVLVQTWGMRSWRMHPPTPSPVPSLGQVEFFFGR